MSRQGKAVTFVTLSWECKRLSVATPPVCSKQQMLSYPNHSEVKDPTSRMAGLVFSWTKALR